MCLPTYDPELSDIQTVNLEFVNETPKSKKARMKPSRSESAVQNDTSPGSGDNASLPSGRSWDPEIATSSTTPSDLMTRDEVYTPDSSQETDQTASRAKRRKSGKNSGPIESENSRSSQRSPANHDLQVGKPSFLASSNASPPEIANQRLPSITELLGQQSIDSAIQGNENSPDSVRSPAAGCSIGELWPSMNVQEACLMRYFIETLAGWVS